jgi:diacylglycerol kinase
MKRLFRSVGFAAVGLKTVFINEPNMRLHAVATASVLVAGVGLRISSLEWAVVIGCIGAVLALECINTSIECLADQVCPDQDPMIKQQVKDAAAGGVLAMSIATAAIGGLVFIPKIMALFSNGDV